MLEDVVNLVDGNWRGGIRAGRLPFEVETVECRALTRFRGHARADDVGDRSWRFGGAEPNREQLSIREVIELIRLLQQRARLFDDPCITDESGLRLIRADALA